ncbi:DNA-3-methyladenine glycosylase III [Geothermobacter ehrlichii]|uniref:DNA-3-methyladenine glycosylase III n=1 Tax=Geothermobacter ehrlichii TaxID=213224 RepID=A0A5D3WI49_9BACT|nr:endonuclease III domain-containing protein [Geothermobacter ehrlichii]TYO98555.1 DNA-3-methyladenine glycosylase III [Geothermobacter ehrlichii]
MHQSPPRDPGTTLLALYQRLFDHFGPQNWWPADSPFETAVGAILTQNTAWTNVEKAIANLRRADALSCEALLKTPRKQLEEMIRPAGFFRQKSERLHLFCRHLRDHHDGNLERLLAAPTAVARLELLELKGVGPETADSILLYGGNHASFVVDAYTRRLLQRLDLLPGRGTYDEIRTFFMRNLPVDAALFNEYHALIVILCKDYCRKRNPRCQSCPLIGLCRYPESAHPLTEGKKRR